MMTSLNYFRETILEDVLTLLWRQWTLLGVPGHVTDRTNGKADYRIIDPEALLLVTSEVGRFEARLFDESVNWLRQYGKLINIQRLKGIRQQHAFGNPRSLAAIASTVMENRRLSKWRAIESLAKSQIGSESLFLNSSGTPSPVFGKPDSHFEKFGFFRGVQKARLNATSPKVEYPDVLLLKLRSLFGVNARAEIIAALLSLQFTHPSALARHITYTSRSIQDILNEMALSGHVVAARPKGSREKYFSLRPGDWNFLITWSDPKFPRWIDWAVIFSLLQETIMALFSEELREASPMLAALRFREIYERHNSRLSEVGLAGYFPNAAHKAGLEFLETFLAELKGI